MKDVIFVEKYSIVYGRDQPVVGEQKHKSSSSEKKGNSWGVILGSTLGVLFVVALVGLAVFFGYRKIRDGN